MALPIGGENCINSELQQFENANFDLGHPVRTKSSNYEKLLITIVYEWNHYVLLAKISWNQLTYSECTTKFLYLIHNVEKY